MIANKKPRQKKIVSIEQYLFKRPPKPPEILEEDLAKTKRELANLRRGLFKRYDELAKELQSIKSLISSHEEGYK